MQTLTYRFPADTDLPHPVHVGAVSSGDLEVILRPTPGSDTAEVTVRTSADGFDTVWRRVLERFFEQSGYRASYEINDFGATPGMVSLRLAQAGEYAAEEGSE